MSNNLKINQFSSGSIADNSLFVIGDIGTGALTQTSYHAMKDYLISGLSFNTASFNSYTASAASQSVNIFASQSNYETTASFLTYSSSLNGQFTQLSLFNSLSASYSTDSSSFNTRIGSITGSTPVNTGSLLLTSSFQTYTGSTATQLINIFASESNYLPTASLAGVNLVTASFTTFSGSYVVDSSSFDVRIRNITGSGGGLTGSFVTTSSFNTFSSSYVVDSASLKSTAVTNTANIATHTTQIANTFASQSNYETTASFNTAITGINTVTASFTTFSSSYVVDSSSFNSRINSATGSGGGGGGTISGSGVIGQFPVFYGATAISASNIFQNTASNISIGAPSDNLGTLFSVNGTAFFTSSVTIGLYGRMDVNPGSGLRIYTYQGGSGTPIKFLNAGATGNTLMTLNDSTVGGNSMPVKLNLLNSGLGTAQLHFAAISSPTSASNGDIWNDGTNLKMTLSGSTTNIITAVSSSAPVTTGSAQLWVTVTYSGSFYKMPLYQ